MKMFFTYTQIPQILTISNRIFWGTGQLHVFLPLQAFNHHSAALLVHIHSHRDLQGGLGFLPPWLIYISESLLSASSAPPETYKSYPEEGDKSQAGQAVVGLSNRTIHFALRVSSPCGMLG